MSLVEPDQRWWRRAGAVMPIVWTLRVLLVVVALLAGWANAQYFAGSVWLSLGGADVLVGVEGVPAWIVALAEITVPVAILVAMADIAADMYACALRGIGVAWGLPQGAGLGLLSFGFGALAATATTSLAIPPTAGIGGIVLGALLLGIRPATRMVQRRIERSQDRTRRAGVRTTAVVTKRDVATVAGRDYWQLTLKFEDGQGRDRWFSHRVPLRSRHAPEVGARLGIAYDPNRPGRRSSIVVSPPMAPGQGGGRRRPMRPNGG